MSDFTDWDSSLAHFGILGMKWGVRRYQNKDGTLTEAGKRHEQKMQDRERRKEQIRQRRDDILHRNRKVSKLSDEELKKAIERAELEKKYNELTRPKSAVLSLVDKYMQIKADANRAEETKLKLQAQLQTQKMAASVANSNAKKAKMEYLKEQESRKIYKTRAKRREVKVDRIKAKDNYMKTKESIRSKTIFGAIKRHAASIITKNGQLKVDNMQYNPKEKRRVSNLFKKLASFQAGE